MLEIINQLRQDNTETAYELLKESNYKYYDLMCHLINNDMIDILKKFTYFLILIKYLKED